MQISPEHVSRIHELSTVGEAKIADLNPTDRKTLFAALRVISQSSEGRTVDPCSLQNAHKTVSDMRAKMDQGQAQVFLTGFAKIWASFTNMVANWFAPSASKIQARATSLSQTLLWKEQEALRSLPDDIKRLESSIKDRREGFNYVRYHNIPVTRDNLAFLQTLQGKTVGECQRLLLEKVTQLEKDQGSKDEDRQTALKPILKVLRGLTTISDPDQFAKELTWNIQAHQTSLRNAGEILQAESKALSSDETRVQEMTVRLSHLREKHEPQRILDECREKVLQGMQVSVQHMSTLRSASIICPDYSRFLDDFTFSVTVEGSESPPERHDSIHYLELRQKAEEAFEKARGFEQTASNPRDLSPAELELVQQKAAEARAEGETLQRQSDTERKNHAFAGLRALAETDEERAIVETVIDEINQKGGRLDEALDQALTTHLDALPRNVKYLLQAGGQGVFKPVTETFIQAIPVHARITFDRERGLSSNAAFEGRRVQLDVRKNDTGKISRLSVTNVMRMEVESIYRPVVNQKNVVVAVPVEQRTEIVMMDGQRHVENSVKTQGRPTVNEDFPEAQKIAERIADTFRELPTQEGQI